MGENWVEMTEKGAKALAASVAAFDKVRALWVKMRGGKSAKKQLEELAGQVGHSQQLWKTLNEALERQREFNDAVMNAIKKLHEAQIVQHETATSTAKILQDYTDSSVQSLRNLYSPTLKDLFNELTKLAGRVDQLEKKAEPKKRKRRASKGKKRRLP